MRYIKVLQDGIARIDSNSNAAGLFTSNLEDCLAIVLVGNNGRISMIHKTNAMNMQEIIVEAEWISSDITCRIVYNDLEYKSKMGLLIELCGKIRKSLDALRCKVSFSTSIGHSVFVEKDKIPVQFITNKTPSVVQLPPFSKIRDTINWLNNMFSPEGVNADRLFVENRWTALPALVPCGEAIISAFMHIPLIDGVSTSALISMRIALLFHTPGAHAPFFHFLRRDPESVNDKLGITSNTISKALSNVEFKNYIKNELMFPIVDDSSDTVERLNALVSIPFFVYKDSNAITKAMVCFNNDEDVKLIVAELDAIEIRYDRPKMEESFIENTAPLHTLEIKIDVNFIAALQHAETEKSRCTLKM